MRQAWLAAISVVGCASVYWLGRSHAPEVQSAEASTPPVAAKSAVVETASKPAVSVEHTPVPIKAEKPKPSKLDLPEFKQAAPGIEVKGRVVPNLEMEVKCRASGQIIALNVDVGDTVAKGQPLFELDASEEDRSVKRAQIALAATRTRLAQAQHNLAIAEKSLKVNEARLNASLRSAEIKAQRGFVKAGRMRETLMRKYVSQEQYDEAEAEAQFLASAVDTTRAQCEELTVQTLSLEQRRLDVSLAKSQVELDELALITAQQRLRDTRGAAPFDGVVTGRHVQAGSFIASGLYSQGTRILTISDLSRVVVLAPVSFTQIGRIGEGDEVDLITEAFPSERFRGRVELVAPKGTVNGAGVTFELRIEVLDDHRHLLRPEMLVTARILMRDLPPMDPEALWLKF